jgi:SAM-dependent methyltransferase
MSAPTIPPPDVMPLDRDRWFEELHLSNFVNTYYQFRDLQSIQDCRKILIVGPGQGLDTQVLKWRGYEVVTFDIDETFKPDAVGSVHDLRIFAAGQFDAVIASHVLEHLAEPHLDTALSEIARIGRYALVYLPVHGRHFQLRLIPGFKELDISLVLDLYNYFRKPDGITPRYMAGQHFWEIGMRGYRVRDIVRRVSRHFDVLSVYRNKDWLPSQNFVLKSKPHART